MIEYFPLKEKVESLSLSNPTKYVAVAESGLRGFQMYKDNRDRREYRKEWYQSHKKEHADRTKAARIKLKIKE